jgi:hypothetical protein
MAANELSARALALTAEVIGMNAAHYTAWCVRVCVRAVGVVIGIRGVVVVGVTRRLVLPDLFLPLLLCHIHVDTHTHTPIYLYRSIGCTGGTAWRRS